MSKEFTPEMLEKAKAAKSPEDLFALAKENDYELSEDEAKLYFERINKQGELSDDELDNVAGGGCHREAPNVNINGHCEYWACERCGGAEKPYDLVPKRCSCGIYEHACKNCIFLIKRNGWQCDNSLRR